MRRRRHRVFKHKVTQPVVGPWLCVQAATPAAEHLGPLELPLWEPSPAESFMLEFSKVRASLGMCLLQSRFLKWSATCLGKVVPYLATIRITWTIVLVVLVPLFSNQVLRHHHRPTHSNSPGGNSWKSAFSKLPQEILRQPEECSAIIEVGLPQRIAAELIPTSK